MLCIFNVSLFFSPPSLPLLLLSLSLLFSLSPFLPPSLSLSHSFFLFSRFSLPYIFFLFFYSQCFFAGPVAKVGEGGMGAYHPPFLFQTIQFCQTVLIQTIQFSISIVFVHTQLNVNTVLFQTIQFNISTQFSSI